MDEEELPEGFDPAIQLVEFPYTDKTKRKWLGDIRIFTFPDTDAGRKAAERMFVQILADKSVAASKIEQALEWDLYRDGAYALFFVFGGYKPQPTT